MKIPALFLVLVTVELAAARSVRTLPEVNRMALEELIREANRTLGTNQAKLENWVPDITHLNCEREFFSQARTILDNWEDGRLSRQLNHILNNNTNTTYFTAKPGNPKKPRKVPEHQEKVPKSQGNVPEHQKKVPKGQGNVPEPQGKVPKGQGKVPEHQNSGNEMKLRELLNQLVLCGQKVFSRKAK